MSDQQIQKVKVRHLARVGLWSADVVTQARFYCQALGLDLRATSEVVASHDPEIAETNMFLGLGEEQHCLGLYGDTRLTTSNGRNPVRYSLLHHLTFEVDTAAELAALAARLKLSDVDFALGTSDNAFDMSDSLWFKDPDGNSIEIAVAPEDHLLSPATVASPRGRRVVPPPYSLQHIALHTPRLDTMVEFYTEALGFDISDWLLRERAWLRCNYNHHTLLFIQGEPGIDHVGYHVADGGELLRWADYLSTYEVPILWGPGRHGSGNDLFLRFADPEGIHIELSAEMQQYYDQDVTIPPRLWHTRAMALNLWGTQPSWLREEAKSGLSS
ncbi:MAG TPA: VOC family protein [Ktedonobacteraceae bacterium]